MKWWIGSVPASFRHVSFPSGQREVGTSVADVSST
jgi:hypothetical protein